MEHPLDNLKFECLSLQLLFREGEKHLDRSYKALGHAKELRLASVSRFLHTREALEYAIQAFAYGVNRAGDAVTQCRNELDKCVAAQIEYNVKEECAKERGEHAGM
jgi:hypothetical protein